MKVSRIIGKSNCKICGSKVISLKLDKPLTKDILPLLVKAGFDEQTHFTKAGILYVNNEGIIATGAFGTTTLQLNCKTSQCDKFINNLEELLVNME